MSNPSETQEPHGRGDVEGPPGVPREAADASGGLEESALDALLGRTLVLDLEATMGSGRVREIGAVLGGDTFCGGVGGELGSTLGQLARFAAGATHVLGHNYRRHDRAHLARVAPGHPVLALPAFDTLELSPLAFPKNPYHRLVKDYKLVRESASDPVADARLARQVFVDQVRAFEALRRSDPELFAILEALLGGDAAPTSLGPSAYGALFGLFRKPPGIGVTSVADLIARVPAWLGDRGCRTVTVEAESLSTETGLFDLAYALAWVSVAGADSVLPAWVRASHPGTVAWLRRWREKDCGRGDCGYCRATHDPREALRRHFRFDDFRPKPDDGQGGSLQRAIVAAGMRDESLLAILPTGGGKSLCFQLPAIVRNQRRGLLTVVLSPLQALMKDQVDGLARRTGLPFAAALSGLQTMPERGAVLEGVATGGVAVLYVSPEQLRNRSFDRAVSQREIGCWVFDEAHCLSKWGHDFRPDYLYAARYIRDLARRQGVEVPPIACFTATAKAEVLEEILAHFKEVTGRELRFFQGGVDRDNLAFAVEPVGPHAKLARLEALLEKADLRRDGPGSAVVFRSRREATEVSAAYLVSCGWRAAHFHAGMPPSEKKRIQDAFLSGDLQVICATNAFGMGIDKEDVRLVIHADTPGSLENYLQEAGRAGRDGGRAECVLLYDERDCEDQFRLGAAGELRRQDLVAILRAVKRADRTGSGEVHLTAGEILRHASVDPEFDADDANTEVRVRTAVAWLERAGFLQRDENVTAVIQMRILVSTLDEARARIATLGLSEPEQALWVAILREVLAQSPTDPLSVDQLAQLPELARLSWAGPRPGGGAGGRGQPPPPELVSKRLLGILRSMGKAGIVRQDVRLGALVRHKIGDHSRIRLDRIQRMERTLIAVLAEMAPEPEGWLPLLLRPLNERLMGEGCEWSTIDSIRMMLRSLAQDGRGFAASHGSLELRHASHERCLLRVVRSWTSLEAVSARRQRVAGRVLDALMSLVPPDQAPRADLRVDFGFDELRQAIDADLTLRTELKDIDAALERALMYLHEHEVIVLQQGLAIFRSAMTLRLNPERRGEQYTVADYKPLQHHYGDRRMQVHIMAEYARRGLRRIDEARQLVLAYFSLRQREFMARYFRDNPKALEHATTADSYRRIVTDLMNPAQIRVVTAPAGRNLLILAGPGSGKTRTVVHRCAYLLRVERVPARSILVCCFNRHAALEVRRRLSDLVGDDARGVLIHTYHGLALRLLGRSLAGGAGSGSGAGAAAGSEEAVDFDALIADAVAMLEGTRVPPGLEPDEVRDRILGGFQHILVDEYQDIDEPQYRMISAIAGRRESDRDRRLSILAVGDDDQNIYTFRGANVGFIARFETDYEAERHYLVENHRSTRHLIEAANGFIGLNRDRMKADQPIRIDRARELHAPGGEFGKADGEGRGRVRVQATGDVSEQALLAVGEVRRLMAAGVDPERIAVLGETHRDLARVRAVMELESIPFRWAASKVSFPLAGVREVRRVLTWLAARRTESLRASELMLMVNELAGAGLESPWTGFVAAQVEAWRVESGDASLPLGLVHEFLVEACAESRHEIGFGNGVTLGTVHAAKGTEHDHVVLVGAWALPATPPARREEIRRVFYVGMTRARHSLTVIHRTNGRAGCAEELEGPSVWRLRCAVPAGAGGVPAVMYEAPGLDDFFLGYAGRFAEGHAVHRALAALGPGSRLAWREGGALEPVHPVDAEGVTVARLSRRGQERWSGRLSQVREIRVLAMVTRTAAMDPETERREQYKVETWELPVVEWVFEEQ